MREQSGDCLSPWSFFVFLCTAPSFSLIKALRPPPHRTTTDYNMDPLRLGIVITGEILIIYSVEPKNYRPINRIK